MQIFDPFCAQYALVAKAIHHPKNCVGGPLNSQIPGNKAKVTIRRRIGPKGKHHHHHHRQQPTKQNKLTKSTTDITSKNKKGFRKRTSQAMDTIYSVTHCKCIQHSTKKTNMKVNQKTDITQRQRIPKF